MDNIKRVLPIRKYQLQKPLVIAFNIHLTHLNAYGTAHYDRLKDVLLRKSGANLSEQSVYLLPNVTNLDTSIERRAHSMSQRIDRLMSKTGAKQCHLVAHSFTGVDARAAISMYGSHNQVESLTTICSPHLGMKLVDMIAMDG